MGWGPGAAKGPGGLLRVEGVGTRVLVIRVMESVLVLHLLLIAIALLTSHLPIHAGNPLEVRSILHANYRHKNAT